jgi:hypothetical protein
LTHLNIANCNFQPEFINFFAQLSFKSLKQLDISGHRFQHEAFCRAFTSHNLSALRVLVMANCRDLNDLCLNLVAKTAHKLRRLCISQCAEITDDGLYLVAQNCNKLTHLDISHCKNVTSRILFFFGKFQNALEEIKLDGCPLICRVKEDFSSFIESHPKLRKISLKNVPIDDDALNSISKYSQLLKVIDLESTSISSSGKSPFI